MKEEYSNYPFNKMYKENDFFYNSEVHRLLCFLNYEDINNVMRDKNKKFKKIIKINGEIFATKIEDIGAYKLNLDHEILKGIIFDDIYDDNDKLNVNPGHFKSSCNYMKKRIIERLSISNINYDKYIKELKKLECIDNKDLKEIYDKYEKLFTQLFDETKDKILINYVSESQANELKIKKMLNDEDISESKLIELPKYQEQIELELYFKYEIYSYDDWHTQNAKERLSDKEERDFFRGIINKHGFDMKKIIDDYYQFKKQHIMFSIVKTMYEIEYNTKIEYDPKW